MSLSRGRRCFSLAGKADAVSSHSGSRWISARVRRGQAAGAAPDFSAGGGLTVTELGEMQLLLGCGITKEASL